MNCASRDIVVEVPPKDFFDVISDYERYPKILPEMSAARIIHRDDTKTVA
jgi:ribosome-associated toxin RatA of RatAB toxin-antitoxin module